MRDHDGGDLIRTCTATRGHDSRFRNTGISTMGAGKILLARAYFAWEVQ